jgi:hypothetical protein
VKVFCPPLPATRHHPQLLKSMSLSFAAERYRRSALDEFIAEHGPPPSGKSKGKGKGKGQSSGSGKNR